MNTAPHDSPSQPSIPDRMIDRRIVLRTGGLATAIALLAAACSRSDAGELGRVGVGADTPELGDATVDDAVLMRTSASFEYSIAEAYTRMLDAGVLAGSSPSLPGLGDQTRLVTLLRTHHERAAAAFDQLAVDSGGAAWGCGNPRLDSVFLDAIFERVLEGAAATDAAPAIDASDDPVRDMMMLVHALESVSASTCQAMVALVSTTSHRATLMSYGVRSARQAALVALTVNPTGVLPGSGVGELTTPVEGDNPPQTPIPVPVALPSQFGGLGATTFIGGRGDENGVRLRVNFETPSLNSLVYADLSCTDA